MEFKINTDKREGLFDITEIIEKIVDDKGFKKGVVHVFVPHATAAMTLNENADPNLPEDISSFLNGIIPQGEWKHDKIDNNADSHIKASLIGSSVFIPVDEGRLLLGTWQDIFLCEFDGPRSRKIIMSFLSSL